MRKTTILLCAVAGLLACTKQPVGLQESAAGVPMNFEVSVAETKATKTAWADGDKIYVFFKGLETKYLVLTYHPGTGWDNTSGGGTLLDTDFSGLGETVLTAVHFPVPVDINFADGKFSFTSGGSPVYCYYFYQTGKAYVIDGTTVTATLALGRPADFILVQVPGIQNNVSDYTFGCSLIEPVACASVGTDGALTENVLQPGARLSGFADEDSGIFSGRLTNPGTDEDYTFTLASGDKIYTLTRDDKALTSGNTYSFPVLTDTGGTNWTPTDVSDLYVDLGLSVLWAKCNLSNDIDDFLNPDPTARGDAYAWGHTFGENPVGQKYDWNNYNTANTIFCEYYYNADHFCYDLLGVENGIGVESGIKKYGPDENKLVLEPEYDAAHVILGGNWRMPTIHEQLELLEYCDWTYEVLRGTGGYRLTSKIPGYTDKSIFLPMQAYSQDLETDWDLVHGYKLGLYWSSSLYTIFQSAYCLAFDDPTYPINNDIGKYIGWDALNRFGRYSIRPVVDNPSWPSGELTDPVDGTSWEWAEYVENPVDFSYPYNIWVYSFSDGVVSFKYYQGLPNPEVQSESPVYTASSNYTFTKESVSFTMNGINGNEWIFTGYIVNDPIVSGMHYMTLADTGIEKKYIVLDIK